jgi:hypothetical protein
MKVGCITRRVDNLTVIADAEPTALFILTVVLRAIIAILGKATLPHLLVKVIKTIENGGMKEKAVVTTAEECIWKLKR